MNGRERDTKQNNDREKHTEEHHYGRNEKYLPEGKLTLRTIKSVLLAVSYS
jgi:hypothetical protein